MSVSGIRAVHIRSKLCKVHTGGRMMPMRYFLAELTVLRVQLCDEIVVRVFSCTCYRDPKSSSKNLEAIKPRDKGDARDPIACGVHLQSLSAFSRSGMISKQRNPFDSGSGVMDLSIIFMKILIIRP